MISIQGQSRCSGAHACCCPHSVPALCRRPWQLLSGSGKMAPRSCGRRCPHGSHGSLQVCLPVLITLPTANCAITRFSCVIQSRTQCHRSASVAGSHCMPDWRSSGGIVPCSAAVGLCSLVGSLAMQARGRRSSRAGASSSRVASVYMSIKILQQAGMSILMRSWTHACSLCEVSAFSLGSTLHGFSREYISHSAT